MQLNRQHIKQLPGQPGLVIPDEKLFALPEKVLQFGTGVLLRGLPDYFIDKANRQGQFNGRIVVVKSTSSAGVEAFDAQDGLYTLCIRGIEQDRKIEENIINSSISRVLSAQSQWKEVLRCAHNPAMEIIISNTTEIGIVPSQDLIDEGAPPSYPGKLLAFLYERYKAFNGSPVRGMIILPAELIVDNATTLKRIVLDLAVFNKLEADFISWLHEANHFCNTLVDRIVPGRLPVHEQQLLFSKLGYSDDLLIIAESFRLWAIETADTEVKERLSFHQADEGIIITGDIDKFRELKLRLLNGAHTFSCGVAFLAGFDTVKEAMANETMASWIRRLMLLEIAVAVENASISYNEACAFANSVLDRFRNPFLDHKWSSITVNFTAKMRLRNIPLLRRLHDKQSMPEQMALSFAAYLLFMKCSPGKDGQYRGIASGKEYVVQDDQAGYFCEKWQQKDASGLVREVLADKNLWGEDLSDMKEFCDLVTENLLLLQQEDVLSVLNSRHLKKTLA